MNTDFKLQSFAFNPAFKPVAQKQLTQTPVVTNNEVKSTQTETLTLSNLKTPRAGSDMEQMVEDLRNNGVMPQLETVAPKVEEKKLREPNSEYMQMMVDSIQSDRNIDANSVHIAVNQNGSIAMLDESHMPGLEDLIQKSSNGHDETKSHDETHGHDKNHGHHLKHEGLLGGHIGTEVVEKIGHGAHEAASHGVNHAISEGANHAVSEAAGTGAAKIAATGGSKVAVHGGDLLHAAGHGVETATEATDATTAGLKTMGEVGHHLSTGLQVALGVGTVGAGVLAVPLAVHGAKELKAGIKEKNAEKVLEGVGGLAVGARSAATAAVMGGMLTTSEVVSQVAHVASSTLTPLGVLHGAIDTVVGGMDIYHGKTTEGLIKIGTGAAIGAAAIVGGLPLTLVALGMLGVKVGHKIFKKSQEKKAAKESAELAAQQQQQQQQTETPNLNATTVNPTAQVQVPNLQLKT